MKTPTIAQKRKIDALMRLGIKARQHYHSYVQMCLMINEELDSLLEEGSAYVQTLAGDGFVILDDRTECNAMFDEELMTKLVMADSKEEAREYLSLSTFG